MNFHANDLDGAYETLSALYSLATSDGEKLETSLKTVITNLEGHWKGNDATIHINNLMDVCKGLNLIINNVKYVAHNVSMPIVKAQTIRNSNGGRGNVGEVIPYNEEAPLIFTQLDPTAEYYVDPVGAPADYNELSEVCDLFTVFCNKFHEYKETLLNNWISGSDRERAVSNFEEFESNVSTYTTKLNNAKGNLEIATSNLKDI